MPFVTACPHCGAAFRAPDHAKGQSVPCARCRKPFVCRPTAVSRPAAEPERSSLWPAALAGVVVALLIGTAGLAFVWLQTRPKAASSPVASAPSSETEPQTPAPEPDAVPESPTPEPMQETPAPAPMIELGPPPSEATEAKKAEPEVAEEPKPQPEAKPEPPKTEVAKADPPKAEPPKPEPPVPEAKPEPKPEPPKPDPKTELAKAEPKSKATQGKLPLGKLPPKSKTQQPKVDPKVEAQVKASLEWLKSRQSKYGCWLDERAELGNWSSNIVFTSFTCLSLMANNDPAHHESIDKAARFVIDNLFQDKLPYAVKEERPDTLGNWRISIGGFFMCEYYAWRKARDPDFDTTELDRVLDQIVEDACGRMEPSGGWGHMPTVPNELGYLELHAVGQWMMATLGACERLGRKVPADKVKLALKFVQDCCEPGCGAVGYSPRNNQRGRLFLQMPGPACPGRTGGAIFGFALLKQHRHPLYPLMTFAWTKCLHFSNEGHGSLGLSMLGSALGARQISEAAWKDFQTRFFPQILEAADPAGPFKHLTGKSAHANGSDSRLGPVYNTAIYTLILQLDNGRLHFMGKQQLER